MGTCPPHGDSRIWAPSTLWLHYILGGKGTIQSVFQRPKYDFYISKELWNTQNKKDLYWHTIPQSMTIDYLVLSRKKALATSALRPLYLPYATVTKRKKLWSGFSPFLKALTLNDIITSARHHFSFHWLELSHVASPTSKEGWEM